MFYKILGLWLSFYDNHFKYRISKAWGYAILNNIKNKGQNIKIHGYCRILDPDKLKIGNHVRIGYNCFFYCKGGLTIGDNCQLSRNITIYTGNHNIESDMIPYDNGFKLEPVTIGNSVWIGMGASILPGVKIGDGAIIGMGTVISKDVPEGAIVVGSAQRIIKTRDMDKFYYLRKSEKYFGKLFPDN